MKTEVWFKPECEESLRMALKRASDNLECEFYISFVA